MEMMTSFIALAGLVLVICVMAWGVWFIRKRYHRYAIPKSEILHATPLDSRHRLVAVRYQDMEYVIVLGPQGFLLDKRKIEGDPPRFQDTLRTKRKGE